MRTIEKFKGDIKIIVRFPEPDEVPEQLKQNKLDELYEILAQKKQET